MGARGTDTAEANPVLVLGAEVTPLTAEEVTLLADEALAGDIAATTWLTAAVAHSSYRQELGTGSASGEAQWMWNALQELGDSVLEATVLRTTHDRHPAITEGELSNTLSGQRPIVIANLAARLAIDRIARLGRGEAEAARALFASGECPRAFRNIVEQVLGALVAVGHAGIAERHIVDALPALTPAERVAGPDPKSSLQEILAPFVPIYQLVSEEGPDHQKSFCWRVTGPRGRTAQGTGTSKRSAQKAAAAAYLAAFEVDAGQRRSASVPSRRVVLPTSFYPKEHHDEVVRHLNQLSLPDDAGALVARALTHRSWSAENSRGELNPPDYGPLARIGDRTIATRFWNAVVHRLAESGPQTGSKPTSKALGYDRLAELARALGIEQALLLGRGLKRSGATESVLVDAAQALAAVIAESRSMEKWLATASDPIAEWIDRAAADTVRGTLRLDFKSELQQIAAVVGVSLEYERHRSGPDNKSEFRSHLTVRGAEPITLVGVPAPSARLADNAAARAALAVARIVNRRPSASSAEILGGETLPRHLARVLLTAEFDAACPERREGFRRYGLLGSEELLAGDLPAFRLWARMAESIVKDAADRPGLHDYYAALTAGLDSRGSRLMPVLQDLLDSVRAIDVLQARGIDQSSVFLDLLDLAAAIGLAASPGTAALASEVVADWSMIARRQVQPESAESPTVPRGDALFALLSALQRRAEHAGGELLVDVCPASIAIVLQGGEAAQAAERSAGLSCLLEVVLPLLGFERDAGKATGRFIVGSVESPSRLEMVALSATAGGSLAQVPAPSILGAHLHDLKNELVACAALASQAGESRTERLNLQYQISTHLDHAVALADALDEMSEAGGALEVSGFDFAAWFKGFVSEKVLTAPAGVQVIPSASDSSFAMHSSPQALKRILENLVSNAFNALVGGGTVEIGWIASPDGGVLVEITDSGRGLPDDVVASLRSGSAVVSRSVDGLGIGLRSAYHLAGRLGGDLMFDTSVHGTRWTLTVPSQTPPSAEPDEFDLRDVVCNATEADT